MAEWYALAVIAGQEKNTRQRILDRLEKTSTMVRGMTIVAPEEDVLVKIGMESKKKRRMSMPGYLLLHSRKIPPESLAVITRVQGVFEFLGGNDYPTSLREEEVLQLLGSETQGVKKAAVEKLYNPGDAVTIIEGPLSDFSGIILDVSEEKGEARVEVEIFGRQTPSTLPLRSLRKGK